MSYCSPFNACHASEIKTPVDLRQNLPNESGSSHGHRTPRGPGSLNFFRIRSEAWASAHRRASGVSQQEEKILSQFPSHPSLACTAASGQAGRWLVLRNYEALLDMKTQFDFYNGGGIDACSLTQTLSMAQVHEDLIVSCFDHLLFPKNESLSIRLPSRISFTFIVSLSISTIIPSPFLSLVGLLSR